MADGCFLRVEWDDDEREATITASQRERMILSYHEVSLLMHELVDRLADPSIEWDGMLL